MMVDAFTLNTDTNKPGSSVQLRHFYLFWSKRFGCSVWLLLSHFASIHTQLHRVVEYVFGYTHFNNDTIALRSYGNLLILLVSRVGHSERHLQILQHFIRRLIAIYLSLLSCGGSAYYVFFSSSFFFAALVCLRNHLPIQNDNHTH